MDGVARRLGFSDGAREPWYNVTNQILIDHGGNSILQTHHKSMSKLLATVYSEFSWDPLRFAQAPRNHWNSLENQKSFMCSLATKLGLKENDVEGWYKVSNRAMIDAGGYSLLQKYGQSMSKLLIAVFPDLHFDASKFKKVPQAYWKSLENQRGFMEDLGRRLGFKEGDMEAWHGVTLKILIDHGGKGILQRYNSSLPKLFQSVFPEYEWKLWKFPRRSALVKRDEAAVLELLQFLEKTLEIKTPLDWRRVTLEQLQHTDYLGKSSKAKKSIIETALKLKYPEEQWDTLSFGKDLTAEASK